MNSNAHRSVEETYYSMANPQPAVRPAWVPKSITEAMVGDFVKAVIEARVNRQTTVDFEGKKYGISEEADSASSSTAAALTAKANASNSKDDHIAAGRAHSDAMAHHDAEALKYKRDHPKRKEHLNASYDHEHLADSHFKKAGVQLDKHHNDNKWKGFYGRRGISEEADSPPTGQEAELQAASIASKPKDPQLPAPAQVNGPAAIKAPKVAEPTQVAAPAADTPPVADPAQAPAATDKPVEKELEEKKPVAEDNGSTEIDVGNEKEIQQDLAKSKEAEADPITDLGHTKAVEEGYVEESLTKNDPVGKWIGDFIKSKNPRFKGKSRKERQRMALGAYYGSQHESTHVTGTAAVKSIADAYIAIVRSEGTAASLTEETGSIPFHLSRLKHHHDKSAEAYAGYKAGVKAGKSENHPDQLAHQDASIKHDNAAQYHKTKAKEVGATDDQIHAVAPFKHWDESFKIPGKTIKEGKPADAIGGPEVMDAGTAKVVDDAQSDVELNKTADYPETQDGADKVKKAALNKPEGSTTVTEPADVRPGTELPPAAALNKPEGTPVEKIKEGTLAESGSLWDEHTHILSKAADHASDLAAASPTSYNHEHARKLHDIAHMRAAASNSAAENKLSHYHNDKANFHKQFLAGFPRK